MTRINDKRRVKGIQWLDGRPGREEPINQDDILNLKVELGRAEDVLEFLEAV